VQQVPADQYYVRYMTVNQRLCFEQELSGLPIIILDQVAAAEH
jgi:hypothetical protein